MAGIIKVGGLNASMKEKENNNESTTKDAKPTKRKTTKKSSNKSDIKKELNKLDEAPKQIETDITKTDDGKVQIDLSESLGPGVYAEVDGDDVERFLAENGIESIKNTFGSSESLPIEESIPEDTNTESKNNIDPTILLAGNTKCYAFLSLKATGIYKPDIISFSLVTEEGKSFYAEFTDIDIMKITPNVLVNILQRRFNLKTDDITPERTCVVGDDKHIRPLLLQWIRDEFTDKGHIMQIVSDQVVNEFGLFLEFLLNGIPLDQYANIISPVCIDINNILAETIDISPAGTNKEDFERNYIPAYIASGISRLEAVGDETPEAYLGNALVNAQCIRKVFRRLYNLDKDEEPTNIINKKE